MKMLKNFWSGTYNRKEWQLLSNNFTKGEKPKEKKIKLIGSMKHQVGKSSRIIKFT